VNGVVAFGDNEALCEGNSSSENISVSKDDLESTLADTGDMGDCTTFDRWEEESGRVGIEGTFSTPQDAELDGDTGDIQSDGGNPMFECSPE